MATTALPSAIEAPIETYIAALNAHDLDRVVSVFTSDGALMAHEAETAMGSAELRAAFAHRFTMFDYGRKLHVEDWYGDAEVAVVRCHTTGSLTIKATGVTVAAVGRELFCLRHIGGQWKIASYMFNRTTPA